MSKMPTFEFHVSRAARDRYEFDKLLFSITGNVVFADVKAAREFAERMNRVRDAANNPDQVINPGSLNAMGLIDEALHALIAVYRERHDPRTMVDAVAYFESQVGREAFHRSLHRFIEQFPPVDVYQGKLSAAEWLKGSSGEVSHRAVALEEMMMLWLANMNPAFLPFRELFDDDPLARTSSYLQIVAGFREYFETRPKFGPNALNLVDVLRAPALAAPESLTEQLAFLREHWAPMLEEFFRRVLTALDIMKEEELAVWRRFHPPDPHRFGGGPELGDSSKAAIPKFGTAAGQDHEYERFSPDVDWMPCTVMMAKTVYVFLDQLTKQYGRHIHQLHEIPDEELDRLARRGFNALWLIGIWERSKASQRIKQLCGNPDAVASAYSLADYNIAEELGGESSYRNLRDRAWLRGIRLASDMVPNHMGIDSRWVIEHPDWFLSLPYSPYPAYQFTGPDLSHDGRVEIKIEDHYYNRTDAAVVFRRMDRWSGDTRYIYHGNDGTSFPWNDTAQLDYLRADVREGVIQTILHVARLFPIIRFDAAMTLAKRHYQRLWFPAPGTGGGIPSRAEQGLTKEEFDAAFPVEFWREVVDRVAAEVPGTLLLAEAFWLMEGYFVRTLGMHRVYNSAFMNMLRDEENANYRSVIKNTLEFDPDVLKRYVNFMNNPDERTAVDQFGKGDRYFGVCTVMSTMPGLPMFGHGQIEGYTEKYGMEYRRAYYNEQSDQWLIARHEREITPLLHRRALFAEVTNFLLYDFYTDGGWVNEDVYAYSNRLGDDRALIVYNNRYNSTSGWVRMSCAYAEKQPDGGRHLRQKSIGESFSLSGDPQMYIAFRDAFTGLEYLHRSCDMAEKGIHLELGGYRTLVLLDWRDVRDEVRPWGRLCDMLGGQGVSSLDDALRALELKPVHDAIYALLNSELVAAFSETFSGGDEDEQRDDARVFVSANRSKRTPTKRPGAPAEPSSEKGRGKSASEEEREEAKITSAVARPPVLSKPEIFHELETRLRRFLEEAATYATSPAGTVAAIRPRAEWKGEMDAAIKHFRERLEAAQQLPQFEKLFERGWSAEANEVLPSANESTVPLPARWATVIAWCALEALGILVDPDGTDHAATELFDGMRMREPFAHAFDAVGLKGEEHWRAAARLRATFAHCAWAPGASVQPVLHQSAVLSWVHDPDVAWLMGVHEYKGERFFNKEAFERLMWWMSLPAMIMLARKGLPSDGVEHLEQEITERFAKAADGGYRVEALVA